MTKEEKIKEAWGKLFDTEVSLADGWRTLFIFNREYDKSLFESKHINYKTHGETYIRPKSLQGIENNNGWIKIESEDDLPKDFITCYIMTIYSDNTIVEAYYSDGERRFKPRDKYSTWSYSFDEITHYQPIEKPKSPIY